MSKRRLALLLSLLLLALLPLAATLAQTGTPMSATATATPPPTSTPVSLCPPDWQETCDWVRVFLEKYGVVGAVLIVLATLTGWFFARFRKVADKKTEEAIEQAVAEAEAADTRADATTRYLKAVIEDYRFCKFRGQGARSRGIEPPELDRVYVSLKVRPETDAAMSDTDGMKGSKRSRRMEEGMLEARSAEPIDLSRAIQQSQKIAIVGVAGSGKSTLLQWAGLAVARARLRDSRLTAEQKEFVDAAGKGKSLLPVLIALRDYNRYCREMKLARTANSLLSFIAAHFAGQYPTLNLPADFFTAYLGLGGDGCLLMFDGVDEVATEDRKFVREAIEDLLSGVCGANPRNRYLITSRTAAYFGVAEFSECLVQNLAPEERDRLIHSWYATVYSSDKAKAKARADDLCQSIADSDEHVKDLAVTPLMVTIFALVHYDDNRLPRQRAALYERAVRTLLTEVEYKEGEAVKELEKWGGKDPSDRRDRLAGIAFKMHDLPNQRGDEMEEDDLIELIWKDFGSDKNAARDLAREFIELVSERGGLLERRGNRYGFFTHRTFREFLAGRYLAEELQDEWKEALSARLMNDQWQEPILLAAGYLSINGEARANQFIQLLAGLGSVVEEQAKALTLAGLAFADLLVEDESRLHPKRIETRELLRPDLLSMLTANPPQASPKSRRDLGLALAALGDPRFAKPLWERPREDVLGDNGYFVAIPAGTFLMGTSEGEERRLKEQGAEAYGDEKPQHPVEVSAFALGKYPVTNAEYRRFVNDPDYANPGYWPGEAGLWLSGQLDLEKHVALYPKTLQENYRNWLKARPPERRGQPYFWNDPQWNADNLPEVGVTWYEAQAYCKWLTQKLRAAKAISETQAVRLPTEAEWEKAARATPLSLAGRGAGGEGHRLWAWGDTWDAAKCNSSASGFNSTTPVGMYPDGTSDYGVMDMIGNVWEWCQSKHKPYPYNSGDGREALDGPGERVFRGGAWNFIRWDCRAACRVGLGPAFFDFIVGFRVVRPPVELLES